MIQRYGKDLGTRIFYAKAAKMRLRPGDRTNLAKPKKRSRPQTPAARALVRRAYRMYRTARKKR